MDSRTDLIKKIMILPFLFTWFLAFSQDIIPNFEQESWKIKNRAVTIEKNHIILDAKLDDGLFWLPGLTIENGEISFFVKGEDVQGQSFVGLAFHIQNDSTYDAVYFRPFNFLNQERNSHSVQYISLPEFDWSKLRNEFPGKYENKLPVPPNPNDWFKVRIKINNPSVKVFVEDQIEPILEVDKISSYTNGSIGFWVGNNSQGEFKNLMISR